MTHGPAEIRRLLERAGTEASRALGQNFVADPNTVRRVARLAGVGPGDRVVEIGAGLGSLTLALAETGAAVTAVEVDTRLVPVLREVVTDAGYGDLVRVVEADAMVLDWDALLGEADRWHLVANLPYNIGTPLVLDVLAGVPAVDHLLVMVQAEVAERLVAGPGSKTYGIPSVKVAFFAEARLVGRVGPNVFVPRPRVASALVEMRRHPQPPVDVEPDRLFALVQAGFGQRRKMIRRSLGGLVSPDTIEAAGLRPDARAEDLGLADWAALARAAGRPSGR